MDEIPLRTIPTRLRNFLLIFDQNDKPVDLRGNRYEFWVYWQLRKRLGVGDIYLDDSVQHRRFADDLVSLEHKADALKALDIPWLRQPVDVTLLMPCSPNSIRSGERSMRNCAVENSSTWSLTPISKR